MDGRISFEFATTDTDGTLLYNGPFSSGSSVADFIGVYLDDGYARARINLGDGVLTLRVVSPSRLNDGAWHSIEIIKQNDEQVRARHAYASRSCHVLVMYLSRA